MDSKTLETFLIHINRTYNKLYNISGLKEIGTDNREVIKDSPYKYKLPGISHEHDSVLMISNSHYPDFVERSVKNIEAAKEILSVENAQVVLGPTHSGRYMNLSYAIWPEQKPCSDHKLILAIQKRVIARRVFQWLRSMAKDSLVTDLSDTFIEENIRAPLKCLIQNPRQSKLVRKKASKALKKLNKKKWRPVTVLQHSDFWLGNILLEKNKIRPISKKYNFCVIDWGGACIQGAPIFDFIQFCLSANVRKRQVRSELEKYAQATQIPIKEFKYFLLVALGIIGINLELFPEKRYIKMCKKNMLYIKSLI